MKRYSLSPELKFHTKISILLFLIISLCFPVSDFSAFSDKNATKRVLIVNSYHPGYSWSDDIMQGIRSVFDGEDNVEIFIEYLDAKRHVDKTYFQQIEQLIRIKYHELNIDATVTSDDYALDFMLGMRKTFHKNKPLIFCGIDHIHPKRISGYDPIYGVVETNGTRSTLDLSFLYIPAFIQYFSSLTKPKPENSCFIMSTRWSLYIKELSISII